MKKIFTLIIASLLFVTVASAQRLTVKPTDYFVKAKNGLTLNASGTMTKFDMTKWGDVYYYAIAAKINGGMVTTSGVGDSLMVELSYSIDGLDYFPIDTAYYRGAASDTTVVFMETSTKVGYPYLSIFYWADDSITANVTEIYGRFIK